jgi:hypothetical protein
MADAPALGLSIRHASFLMSHPSCNGKTSAKRGGSHAIMISFARLSSAFAREAAVKLHWIEFLPGAARQQPAYLGPGTSRNRNNYLISTRERSGSHNSGWSAIIVLTKSNLSSRQ